MRHEFVALAVLGAMLAAAPGAEFDLSRHSIDGGGGLRSTGGAFELSGTIGQPDAGVLAGGAFELTGGFWFEIPPADCNDDGTADLRDHASLSQCLSGPGAGVTSQCACFDVDRSGTVDLEDVAASQSAFAGG